MIVSREPAILYFGTPVALISTRNPDGAANLAPMSSVFWLGWRAVLGLAAASQTARNLVHEGEAVINLPSEDMAGAVDRLASPLERTPFRPTRRPAAIAMRRASSPWPALPPSRATSSHRLARANVLSSLRPGLRPCTLSPRRMKR